MSRQLPTSIRDYPEARAYMEDEVSQLYGPSCGITPMRLSDDQLERLWRGLPDERPASEGRALLRECNIPIREAARPTHAIVADLAPIVPPEHDDRQHVDRLRAKGAATTSADDNVARVLARRWGVDTGADEPPAQVADGLDEDGVPVLSREAARGFLRESGIPVKGDGPSPSWQPLGGSPPPTATLSDVAEAMRDAGLMFDDTGDPKQFLRDCGVAVKGD